MAEEATFSDLVREAFIDPLRSVLIVDDEYPTWEEIFNSAVEGVDNNAALQRHSSKKPWSGLPSGPLKVIKEFRSRNPGFVIDVHDPTAPKLISDSGVASPQETPDELADHLHQSDLLVLDYNLEGEQTGTRGAMARDILRKVLINHHFNLVIVHTGESDLDEVMAECLIGLMQSCTSKFDGALAEEIVALDYKLDELEIEEIFDRRLLNEYFNIEDYLEARLIDANGGGIVRDYMAGRGRLAKLLEWGKMLDLSGRDLVIFLYWGIREFEKNKIEAFSKQALEGLKWRSEPSCKWLRTTKGFVSFVKKGPEDLLGELQRALENWRPTPSRLLSAKYRHALNSIGVEAEDKTLLKNHVFAQFYSSICEPARKGISSEQSDFLRDYKLKDHVSRQSEAISFLIEDELVQFGKKIIGADKKEGNNFSNHYGIDLSDAETKKFAVAHYNCYISTLPLKLEADQLDSGHVFKLGNDWWVCATPACDLQPGQSTIAFTGSSDELRPFTALKLVHNSYESLERTHINSGSYCFVEEKETGKIVGLGLRSISDETKPATQKVTWRTFVATRRGKITDGSFKVIQLKLGEQNVENEELEATVVAKLRYEYALNYIQRVGASVSRIGLGYVAP